MTAQPFKLHCEPQAKPDRKKRNWPNPINKLYIDDYPVLLRLIPASTQPRRDYMDALERELGMGYEVHAVIAEALKLARRDHILGQPCGFLWVGCVKPRGQAIILGLCDFLAKYGPVVYAVADTKTTAGLNAEGMDYIKHTVEYKPL